MTPTLKGHILGGLIRRVTLCIHMCRGLANAHSFTFISQAHLFDNPLSILGNIPQIILTARYIYCWIAVYFYIYPNVCLNEKQSISS